MYVVINNIDKNSISKMNLSIHQTNTSQITLAHFPVMVFLDSTFQTVV